MDTQTAVIRTAILQADAAKRTARNKFLKRLAARVALYGSLAASVVVCAGILFVAYIPASNARIADAKVQINWYDVLRESRQDTKFFRVQDENKIKLARR
jgi:hypothetical protein